MEYSLVEADIAVDGRYFKIHAATDYRLLTHWRRHTGTLGSIGTRVGTDSLCGQISYI